MPHGKAAPAHLQCLDAVVHNMQYSWRGGHSSTGRDVSPDARGVHAQNELIYQESRAQAEAARGLLSDAVLSGFVTEMGGNVRIWVSPQPSAEQTI